MVRKEGSRGTNEGMIESKRRIGREIHWKRKIEEKTDSRKDRQVRDRQRKRIREEKLETWSEKQSEVQQSLRPREGQ